MRKSARSTPQSSAEPDEAPELTAEWFAGADLYEGDKLVRRGRPRSASKKQLVSLRLSPSVLDHFKATGPGWQTRIDDTLKSAVQSRSGQKSSTTAVSAKKSSAAGAKKAGPKHSHR